jgi:hypothetical protein
MTQFISVLTFIAACYLSVACFCIIHRMTSRTRWSLALPIIGLGGIGAYALIESASCLVGASPALKPLLIVLTLAGAVVLLLFPRIDTGGPRHGLG